MILDVLVVSPHPDDAELGMAGAILKFKAEGLSVGVLDLTDGEPTPLGSPEIRLQETAAATELARDFHTRLYHDPLYGRGYPESVQRYYEGKGASLPVRGGDLETIAAQTDHTMKGSVRRLKSSSF